MKKLSILCASLLLAISAFAEKGAVILTSPLQMQVMAVSPNGKYACGIIGDGQTTMLQGALWNLETDEFIYLSTLDESSAFDVTDDGLVVGAFTSYEVVGNGVGTTVAGWYKDGKWYAYDNTTIEGVSLYDAQVSAVSNDGRVAVGYVNQSGRYVPAKWVDGVLSLIYPLWNTQGMCYAVSADGKYAAGWAYKNDDDGDENRTIALWTDETIENLSDFPSFAEAGRAFSVDGKKLLCEAFGSKFVYDLETKEKTMLPAVHPDVWTFLPTHVTNEGAVIGGEEVQSMSSGYSDVYGYYYDGKSDKAVKLTDWLRDVHNVTIDESAHKIFRGADMSSDGKVIAMLDYPLKNGQMLGDWATIVVKLDQEIGNPAPIALAAEKLRGINSVRLSWRAPLVNAENVMGYNIYRNNEVVVEGQTDMAYIDNLASEGVYTYTVTALYEGEKGDFVESEPSVAVTINVVKDTPNSVQNIQSHGVNYNDLNLRWSVPASNLPSAAYYKPEDQFSGFGGGIASFAVAMQVPSDMVSNYAQTHRISRVSFMPRNAEAIYTIKVSVNGQEVSSKTIADNSTLRLNEHNIIDLDTPAQFDADDQVRVIVEVNADNFTAQSNNVIGMVYGKVTPGYSDLCRQISEPEFYSMSERAVEQGMGEMPMTWAIAAIFSTVDENGTPDFSVDKVTGYEVYRNEELLANVSTLSYMDTQVPTGKHVYEVVAKYADGATSNPASINVDFAPKTSALVPVEKVKLRPEPAFIEASWEAPINNDLTHITYAIGKPSGKGIVLSGSTELIEYTVATLYSTEFLKWYQGYTIDALTFYPTAEAVFMMVLEVNGEDVDFIEIGEMNAADGYTLNTWNTVKLTKPVKIEPNTYYVVKLVCMGVDPSTYAVNTDNSVGILGVTDLYSWDFTSSNNMSSAQADGSLSGNWMIGMRAHNDNQELLPVNSYKVFIDGKQAGEVSETTFKQEGTYTEGSLHRVKVNTVYNVDGTSIEVDGKTQVFNIAPTSVESVVIDRVKVYPNPATSVVKVEGEVEKLVMVDMAGRVVAESNTNTLDVTTLPAANYLLNIYNGNEAQSVKVIVVR